MIFFLMYIDSMFLKGEISEGIPARRAALPTKKGANLIGLRPPSLYGCKTEPI